MMWEAPFEELADLDFGTEVVDLADYDGSAGTLLVRSLVSMRMNDDEDDAYHGPRSDIHHQRTKETHIFKFKSSNLMFVWPESMIFELLGSMRF